MFLTKSANRSFLVTCVFLFFGPESQGQERIRDAPRPGIVPDSRSSEIGTRRPVATTTVELPVPELTSGFGIPEGLETKPEILFPKLGYGPPDCFVLTPMTCFDAGYLCYSRGMYADALAFASHGLKLSNHARLYLLKAVCEMHLGSCHNAETSIYRYRAASSIPLEAIGLGQAQERINDPMRVRLELLLMATR